MSAIRIKATLQHGERKRGIRLGIHFLAIGKLEITKLFRVSIYFY